MNENEIIFNYRQTIRQADRLENLAGKLDRLSEEQMGNILGGLKNSWRSDSAPQYFTKASKVQTEIKTTANNMKAIARTIRVTAETVRKAELRALSIAKSRTYR